MVDPKTDYNAVIDILVPKFFEGMIPHVILLRVFIGYFNMGGPKMQVTGRAVYTQAPSSGKTLEELMGILSDLAHSQITESY